jgi:uncharacterized protein with HEPN domain
MPSEWPRRRLQDIRDNIYLIDEWTRGLTFDQFEAETMRVYAVVRALEIISEASRRLDDELKTRHADILWADIAGAGNIYRHNYDNVEQRRIWHTATTMLPPLLAIVESELGR